jgi:hypothetical protein
MQISATLIVSGDLLDPEQISKILNVTPHASKRKGDVKTFNSQKSIVAKFGLWEWRSRDPSGTLTVNDHVAAIANTFEKVYDELLSLPNAENTWIDLHFVAGDNAEEASSVGFLLSPESIATLCKTGLPVEITVDALSSTPPKISNLE